MRIGSSKIGASFMAPSLARLPLTQGMSAPFSHAVNTSSALTFSNLPKELVLYQANHPQMIQAPPHETAVEVYKRLDHAPSLLNVWDTTPPPQVEVTSEPEEVKRLLSIRETYKYAVVQHLDNADDTRVLLCRDVSAGHKALAAQGEALGYQRVAMAGHVTGNPESRVVIITNTSGHYQPRATLPTDHLPSQFQVAESAFARLGWTALGKSYVWWKKPEAESLGSEETPMKTPKPGSEGKYLPDNQYELSEGAVEFRPGAQSKRKIVDES